ncbi:MAG: hypothetical protein QF886_04375, partial [Planctomycetota bacterium]|nr:hypothetical protein [Planctomycetota bacterium]
MLLQGRAATHFKFLGPSNLQPRQPSLEMLKLAIASTACILTSSAFGEIADAELRDHVTKAMRKAAVFYRSKVARHGGYVY